MKISVRPIQPFSFAALRMRSVFLEAFPPEERPPYLFLLLRTKSPVVDYCGIFAEERPVGLAYTLKNDRAAYLFFLAIRRSDRGKGFGSEAMRLLLNRYQGLSVFLAHEELDASADNYEERIRRHELYLRCGLRDIPFTLREGQMTYAVMGNGGAVSPKLYRELMEPYLGRFSRYLPKTYLADTYLYTKEAASE